MAEPSVVNEELKAEKPTPLADAQPSLSQQESSAGPVLYPAPLSPPMASEVSQIPAVAFSPDNIPDGSNASDKDDGSLLLKASKNGDRNEVERLLRLNTSVASKADTGETALHLAARNGNESVVELLLKHNADVEARDDDGWVPLYGAAAAGHTNIVTLLLDAGSQIDARMPEGWTPLAAAVRNGEYGTIKLLLERGADANIQKDDLTTPLAIACDSCELSKIPVVRLLLDHNAQLELPDADGWTPLMMAIRFPSKEVGQVSPILDSLDNIKDQNLPGASFAIPGQSPKDQSLVELLLAKGARVDVHESLGWTPLQIAARYGSQPVVQLLLNYKADVDAVDTDGWTALHTVPYNDIATEREPIARMLLDSNAKLMITDSMGHTPLHKACQKGCKDVAELLIERGAAVNARDSTGWNPLHLASYRGYDEVVKLLLDKNADRKIMTNDTRETVLVLAIDGLSNEEMEDKARKKSCMNTIVLLGGLVDPIERKDALRYCADQVDLEELMKLYEFKLSEIREIKLIWFASRKDHDQEMCDILVDPDVDTSIRPVPNSALEWAAYHGNAVVTWWILKTYSVTPDQLKNAKEIAKTMRGKLSTSHGAHNLGALVGDDKIDRRKPASPTRLPIAASTVKDRNPQQRSGRARLTKDAQRKGDLDDDRHSQTLDILEDPPVVIGLSDRGGPYKLPELVDISQAKIANYYATIVDFYHQGRRVDFLRRQTEVFNVIYHPNFGAKNIMEKARARLRHISPEIEQVKSYDDKDLKLRWIHLPVNNMLWMEDLVKRIFFDKQRSEDEYFALIEFMRKTWQEVSTVGSKASFMKPMCLKSQPLTRSMNDQPIQDKGTQTLVQSVQNMGTQTMMDEPQGPLDQDRDIIHAQSVPTVSTKQHRDMEKDIQDKSKADEQVDRPDFVEHQNAMGTDPRQVPKDTEQPEDADNYNRIGLYEMPYITLGRCYSNPVDDPSKKLHEDLCEAYKAKDNKQGRKPIHGSRSLDQFYYHSLSDLKQRDAGQVVTRYLRKLQGKVGDGTPNSWPIITVDQLWLWVIDSDTIITSSTYRYGLEDPVMDKIFDYLVKEKGQGKGQPPPSSVEEMSIFIVNFCVDLIEERNWNVDTNGYSAHQIFADTINQKAAEEANLFKAFTEKTKRKLKESRDFKTKRKERRDFKEKPGGKKKDSLEAEDWKAISEAAELLEEVKDIRDELNIFKALLADQKSVWKGLSDTNSDVISEKGPSYVLREVEEMDQTSSTIQDSVNGILGLEQNGINITEAVLSRGLAEESVRQSRTLMVFTIVTIIFLPLSFFTSLFALNITSFQHDSQGNLLYQAGWIFPIIFCTSFVIIVLLLLCAFNVDDLTGILHFPFQNFLPLSKKTAAEPRPHDLVNLDSQLRQKQNKDIGKDNLASLLVVPKNVDGSPSGNSVASNEQTNEKQRRRKVWHFGGRRAPPTADLKV